MELEIENYLPAQQGQQTQRICVKTYEIPIYSWEEDMSLEQINQKADEGWLVKDTKFKEEAKFGILFERIPIENCFATSTILTGDSFYEIKATPLLESEQKSEWSFLVKKDWTYGDITTNILLIVILSILVWDILRNIFKTKFYSK